MHNHECAFFRLFNIGCVCALQAFLYSPKNKQIIDVTAKNRGGMDVSSH